MLRESRSEYFAIFLFFSLFLFSSFTYSQIIKRPGSFMGLYDHYNTDIGSFNGNRLFIYLENDGTIVTDDFDGNAGLYWPDLTTQKTAVFSAGLWLSGKINNIPLIAVSEYASMWNPGRFLDGIGPDDSKDPKYRIYKINRRDILDPCSNPDWMNWPIDQGAPWIDADGDGRYEPLKGDKPDLTGDQMIWYVMNDWDFGPFIILPPYFIGLECKVSLWGYNRLDALGDVLFCRFQFRNVLDKPVDSCFVGIWSDPDIGNPNDDFVGCDTTLHLGFCFNDGADDIYGAAAPAVGFSVIQGPMVFSPGDTAFAYGRKHPDRKSQGMWAFLKYIENGGDYFGLPETAGQCWNNMSGLSRSGKKFIDPTTGLIAYPVRYASGDPCA